VPRPYNNNYIGGLVGMNTGENAIISKQRYWTCESIIN
jgi:hypothetical protein